MPKWKDASLFRSTQYISAHVLNNGQSLLKEIKNTWCLNVKKIKFRT